MDDASAVMTPIIRGAEVAITSDVKRILATWAFKTAIVAEYLEQNSRVTPEIVYRYLRDNKSVPSGYNVFVAPYMGEQWYHLALHQFFWKSRFTRIKDGEGISRNVICVNHRHGPRALGICRYRHNARKGLFPSVHDPASAHLSRRRHRPHLAASDALSQRRSDNRDCYSCALAKILTYPATRYPRCMAQRRHSQMTDKSCLKCSIRLKS